MLGLDEITECRECQGREFGLCSVGDHGGFLNRGAVCLE